MGRNGSRTMAIVRVGGRSTAKMMTEGSREFCSILETECGGKGSSTIYYLAGKNSPGVILSRGRIDPGGYICSL